MTYEEREKRLCNNCEAKENCSYISRNLERKCSFKETTMYGWELGYKDAIEKACEYIKNNHADIFIRYIRGYEADDEIELLKKYMEEQQ